jgi:hypothetical protein
LDCDPLNIDFWIAISLPVVRDICILVLGYALLRYPLDDEDDDDNNNNNNNKNNNTTTTQQQHNNKLFPTSKDTGRFTASELKSYITYI